MVDKVEPDRSKIGKSNVRKGKTYERRVASLLGEFTGVQFRRRRVEGRDLSVVERESTADVIPVTGDIKFSIEAKSGKGFSFDAILGNPLTKTGGFINDIEVLKKKIEVLEETVAKQEYFKKKVYWIGAVIVFIVLGISYITSIYSNIKS